MKVSELIAVLKQLPQDEMINIVDKDGDSLYAIYEPVVKPLTLDCDGERIGWIIVPVRLDA
jgi:hypothetical protein